jgi:sporulation protein YlmC with PRC-barrel domain
MKIAQRSLQAVLLSGLLALGWAGVAWAQENQANKKGDTAPKATFERATILKSLAVKNTKGEELGRMRDLMINAHDGHVCYAVLGYGGTVGFGEKFIAVPLSALQIEAAKDRPNDRYFVLDMAKATLDANPGFNKQDWPNDPDAYFLKGAKPAPNEKVRARRASVLIGMAAKSPKGDALGTIRDLMVNTTDGQVVYAALGHGGGLITAEKHFAIPWSEVTLKSLTGSPADECFVINLMSSALDNNAGFDTKQWPTSGDRKLFEKGADK